MQKEGLWYRCKVYGDKWACKKLASNLTVERGWLKSRATVDFMDGCSVEVTSNWRGVEIEKYNEKCNQTQIEVAKEIVEENNVKPVLKEVWEDFREVWPVIKTGANIGLTLLEIL